MQIPKMTVIGLMSGTSLDGMDIAIVDLQKRNEKIDLELRYFKTVPYEKEIKNQLEKIVVPNAASPEISSMNILLGEVFAEGIQQAIEDSGIHISDIKLISSHGQTIFHDSVIRKDTPSHRPNTLQIGDISIIAERTGITTIGDFRTRDMAVGGQGAPLVPFLDYHLFKSEEKGRALVNIGGIANITVIPRNSDNTEVIAYDTGPGNMLLDAFVFWHTKGKESYDDSGTLASKGTVDEEWLEELLKYPYYEKTPPKTTGREQFGMEYARELWEEAEKRDIPPLNRIATLTSLTSVTLGKALADHIKEEQIEEVYISGGGWHNQTMMERLKAYLPKNVRISSSKELGIDGDAKEAIAFALFGYLGFHKQPNNLPAATGASKTVMMGKISWGESETISSENDRD